MGASARGGGGAFCFAALSGGSEGSCSAAGEGGGSRGGGSGSRRSADHMRAGSALAVARTNDSKRPATVSAVARCATPLTSSAAATQSTSASARHSTGDPTIPQRNASAAST